MHIHIPCHLSKLIFRVKRRLRARRMKMRPERSTDLTMEINISHNSGSIMNCAIITRVLACQNAEKIAGYFLNAHVGDSFVVAFRGKFCLSFVLGGICRFRWREIVPIDLNVALKPRSPFFLSPGLHAL